MLAFEEQGQSTFEEIREIMCMGECGAANKPLKNFHVYKINFFKKILFLSALCKYKGISI